MHGIRQSISHHSRQFFVRGLAILLPSVLTVWLLLAGYQFVQSRIAEPVNAGIRELILHGSPWPRVSPAEVAEHRYRMQSEPGRAWARAVLDNRQLEHETRRAKLQRWWRTWAVPMDMVGLVVAVAVIYAAGVVLGSFIGRRLYARGEALIARLPLVGRVYPAVKQVTDFVTGQEFDAKQFSRVVAIEYPREGIWCIGMATGEAMKAIDEAAGETCMTVFVPSAPTPFTGYVVSVPKRDVLELPITIEDAVKFLMSGGVLTPPTQLIKRDGRLILRDASGHELPLPDPDAPPGAGETGQAKGREHG